MFELCLRQEGKQKEPARQNRKCFLAFPSVLAKPATFSQFSPSVAGCFTSVGLFFFFAKKKKKKKIIFFLKRKKNYFFLNKKIFFFFFFFKKKKKKKKKKPNA